MGTFALALLMGGLLASCKHMQRDQPDSGQRPTRTGSGSDRGSDGGGSY